VGGRCGTATARLRDQHAGARRALPGRVRLDQRAPPRRQVGVLPGAAPGSVRVHAGDRHGCPLHQAGDQGHPAVRLARPGAADPRPARVRRLDGAVPAHAQGDHPGRPDQVGPTAREERRAAHRRPSTLCARLDQPGQGRCTAAAGGGPAGAAEHAHRPARPDRRRPRRAAVAGEVAGAVAHVHRLRRTGLGRGGEPDGDAEPGEGAVGTRFGRTGPDHPASSRSCAGPRPAGRRSGTRWSATPAGCGPP
jgi:hypothetical protein